MMMMMMMKKLFLSLVVLLIGIQVVQAVQAQTQSSSLPPPLLRSNNEDVSLSLSSSSSSSLRLLQKKKNNDIDYTCYPSLDYSGENKCPTIGDGKCDNPNHGGTEELCIEQDCIDCNFNCQSFSTDCYGCMTAIGCYYCEGDATCNNSNLYQSSNKALSCTKPEDFFLGGLGDSKEKCIPPNAPTQDPLSIANEWMFKMINVQYVWNTLKLTGKGIKIRINDDGVDINNKEFEGNNKFDKANSCVEWEPTPGDTDGHGTTVAGIVVGNANNDFCSAGIAYDATFSACNFFAKGVPYSSLAYKINTFDISQNSIGSPACSEGAIQQGNNMGDDDESNDIFNVRSLQAAATCQFKVPVGAPIYEDPCDISCDYSTDNSLSTECENAIYNHCKANYRIDNLACADFNDIILGGGMCNYDKLPKSAIDALATGIAEGRNGKGVIFVFASGNKFYEGDDINMSAWTNSRYTITVGAVGKDGKHTDYSTPGAALMVSGPAGDFNDVGHIISAGLDGTCTNSGSGTSFSCPVVSGVIALMLEARSELTWRDVQGIIASTSKKVNDPQDKSAQTNSAKVWHSDWYGFGIIDAKKAVDAAFKWELLSPEEQAMGVSKEENEPIPNNGNEFVSELTIGPEYEGFISESVVILLDLQHYSRGDLKVTLVSPKGTQSVLHAGKRPESTLTSGDQRWKLMTVRTWGEDPTGIWKLKVQDLVVDSIGTTNGFKNWKLTAYGRSDGDTEEPTLSPTKAAVVLTDAPTETVVVLTDAPTEAPVVVSTPTTNPTKKPRKTKRPTRAPTSGPTIKQVTVSPTKSPVPDPTSPPTAPPTTPPTTPPTVPPTTPPTLPPTRPPTLPPTLPPTFFAVERPSFAFPTDPRPTTGSQVIPIMGSVPAVRPDPISAPVPPLVPAPISVQSVGIPTPTPGIPTPIGSFSFKPPHYNSMYSVQRPSTASLPGQAVRVRSSYTGTVTTSASSSNVQNIPLSIGRSGATPQTTTTTLKRMGAVETESVEDLSIVLEGLSGEIPESTILSIQTVLEEHTNSVVAKIFPGIHFQGTVRVTSVTPNGAFPADYYNRKRHLRLEQQQQQRETQSQEDIPSVTVHYNGLVMFDRLNGTEGMNGNSLASLALETLRDRQDFVDKIHNELNGDPVLQSLVGVSTVSLPPTPSPSALPTTASIPTLPTTTQREKSDNIFGDEMNEDPTTSTIAADNVSMSTVSTVVIVCWSVIGLGLLVGSMFLIFKKMRK